LYYFCCLTSENLSVDALYEDNESNCNHLRGKFLWTDDCKDDFIQALVEPESTKNIMNLYNDLNDENNSDIPLVKQLTEFILKRVLKP
jgi:hypothetical protein